MTEEKTISQVNPDQALGRSLRLDGNAVRVSVGENNVGPFDSSPVEVKSSSPLPGESKDARFIRLFKGAFFTKKAMAKHGGRKAKRK